jgi:hypothetical protein
MPTTLDRPMFLFSAVDIFDPVDATTTLVLTLPAMTPLKSTQTIGGDIDGDSGIRAAYRVLDSELLTLTLRFFETQWLNIVDMLDHVMDGHVFLYYPLAVAEEFSGYFVQLDSPAPGTSFSAQPDAQYPRVLTLTIVLRAATTFDDFDVITPAFEILDFGRGPSAGKVANTMYHDATMTLGSLTVTWPNYVFGVVGSPGWQGVLGTGADAVDPQSMLFDKPVKEVSVYWEEMNFYDGYMAAYDALGVEIGRYTLTLANVTAHGPTADIAFPDNRIYKVTMVPNADWVTYSHVVITRDLFLGGGS